MKDHARNLSITLAVIGVVAAHGCAKQEKVPVAQQNGTLSDAETENGPTPKERALQAKEALFKRLSSELMAAMSNAGPSAAIAVCSQKAPKIAEDVGREHGVSIGRTSFKLRNPANKPPEWAVNFVEQRVAKPQFVELDNHATGALLPIRLQPQCLACHGDKNQIADEVHERLAALYPEDSATGFKDGDLRGWFWVEVPAEAVPFTN